MRRAARPQSIPAGSGTVKYSPLAAAMAAVVLIAGPLGAQESRDSLTLAEALDLAHQANPALAAERLRADGAAQRVPQAGAFPDPQLSFGLMNRPLNGFGTDEPMTMNVVQLTQMVPWPGKRGYAEERADHLARATAWDALEAGTQLASRVKQAYYELAYTDRAITITERTRGLMRDFFQVSQAKYSVGQGLQQDVLQAQVAVARMTEDLTVMQQDRIATAARLNALMGRPATTPVGSLSLPQPGAPIPPADSLLAVAVANRPALQAASERAVAASAGYRAARRELYPDFMVSVGYGQRPQFDDMLTVMVGISLPLWSGSRQLPMRREMAAMQASEEAMAKDLSNETYAEVTELRAEAERARSLSQLYATSILPQAHAAVESSLSAYRVGKVDYLTLVENEMTVNRYDIESVRLAARYYQAVAQIDALLGREEGSP